MALLRSLVINLCICFFLFLCLPTPAALPPLPDGFRMALFWPPGYCSYLGSKCNKNEVVARFTAHGLWAFEGSDQNSMSSRHWRNQISTFDSSKIEGMKDELKYYWTSFQVSQSNEDLWSKEWNKHGVSSEHVLDQHTYFQRGLQITKSYDLVAILGRAGIVPDDKAYSVKYIQSALEEGLKVKPEISCHFNASKHYVLSEIRIWFDASAMNPINCKKPVCQETTIYFMG